MFTNAGLGNTRLRNPLLSQHASLANARPDMHGIVGMCEVHNLFLCILTDKIVREKGMGGPVRGGRAVLNRKKKSWKNRGEWFQKKISCRELHSAGFEPASLSPRDGAIPLWPHVARQAFLFMDSCHYRV